MAFEEFQRKKMHTGEPAVSIGKYGNFVLNSTAIRKYFTQAKYAKLYWDESERKIGIRPVTTKDAHSYAINFGSNNGVGSFSGTAFLKAHGIKYAETKSFDASWDEKEGLLVLKVD